MRTTLTLDDDVATRLERLRAQGGGMKQLVNDVLRIGLDQLERRPTPHASPFRTETFRLGAKVTHLDDVAEVLAVSETEDWR